jgi:hypothetical protein
MKSSSLFHTREKGDEGSVYSDQRTDVNDVKPAVKIQSPRITIASRAVVQVPIPDDGSTGSGARQNLVFVFEGWTGSTQKSRILGETYKMSPINSNPLGLKIFFFEKIPRVTMTDSETEDDGWEKGSRDEEQSDEDTFWTHTDETKPVSVKNKFKSEDMVRVRQRKELLLRNVRSSM